MKSQIRPTVRVFVSGDPTRRSLILLRQKAVPGLSRIVCVMTLNFVAVLIQCMYVCMAIYVRATAYSLDRLSRRRYGQS